MPRTFQTLTQVPDLSQANRFAQVPLGASNTGVVRDEHVMLTKACADLLGVPVEQLTYEQVQSLSQRKLEPIDAPAPASAP